MTSQILPVWLQNERDANLFGDRSTILRSRSPFFPQQISPNDCYNNTTTTSNRFEYFPQTTFETILSYTYNGTVSLESLKQEEIFELLLASAELCIQNLTDRIQTYLLKGNDEWVKTHFVLAYRTAFQDSSLGELQAFCTATFEENPEVVFQSKDFTTMQKHVLMKLLKQKNPTMKQVDIWEYLLQWGIAQTPDLPPNVGNWSSAHYSALKRTIRDFIPLIRFYKISADEFYNRVIPFEKALPRTIFHDILRHYLLPQPPLYTASVPPPPYPAFDSTIISTRHLVTLTDWIARSKQTPSDSQGRFQFNLLLRSSCDGYSPLVFHSKCDLRGPTLVVIKVRGTGQIIGGYNPDTWRSELKLFSTSYHNTAESFIFSLGDGETGDAVCSRVKDPRRAIGQYSHLGPDFGESDLSMQGFDYHDEKLCFCKQDSYEHSIMGGNGNEKVYFSVEDYEVFEIIQN